MDFRLFRTLAISIVAASIALSCSVVVNAADTIKVFLLVGQSNMEGKGNPIHLDTYKNDPMIKPTYAGLKDGEGWKVRDDVWITYPSKSKGAKHGALTVGYGTKGENSIGPEFGFGHAIGNGLEQPVVIIKAAWGGKSLLVDFRPPSVAVSEEEIQAMLTKAQRKKPKTTAADIKQRYGHYYREMVKHVRTELDQLEKRFPNLKGAKPEIAGFVWHQGFNDKVNRDLRNEKYARYTTLLQHFIRDVRKEFASPQLPFVIGELSTGGIPARGDFQVAQENAAKLAEFKGNVMFVKTAEYYDMKAQELFKKGFWKGTDEQKAQWRAVGNDRPYHYLGSGKTYYLKGVAFADAMLKMLAK